MPWLDRGLHSVSQINFAVPAAAGSFPQYALSSAAVGHAMALSATTGMCLQAWLKTKAPTYTPPVDVAQSASSAASAPSSAAPAAQPSAAHTGVPSVKFVSTGLACSRGIESLQLARVGVTASVDAVESMVRFFNNDQPMQLQPFLQVSNRRVLSGSLHFALATIAAHRSALSLLGPVPFCFFLSVFQLGSMWTMDRHLVKQFSAQFNLQAAISCALQLHAQGVRLDSLSSLVVRGHRFVCGGVQGSAGAYRPMSQGSADHSTPFVVCMALLHGSFTPHTAYKGEPWLDAHVLAVMQRITLLVDEQLEQARVSDGALGCRMEAILRDGSVVSAAQLHTAGHPSHPLSDEELLLKWRTLLTPLYGERMHEQLWHACESLQHCNDGTQLAALERLLSTPFTPSA